MSKYKEYKIVWGCEVYIKSNDENEGQIVADIVGQHIDTLIEHLKKDYPKVEITVEW